MITSVTPAGPAFFCAPAKISPYRATSIGALKTSDEASLTIGAWVEGSAFHWVPSIVLFDVTCTYAGSAENCNSCGVGMRLKLSPSVDATTCVFPTLPASFKAFCDQDPVTT